MSNPHDTFSTPNPHALACILEAAETRQIISATDIFDDRGFKLWAADQPVTADLQRKLADRRLKQPLERSLVAADGLTVEGLIESLQPLLEPGHALAPLLAPHAEPLEAEIGRLQLQPAAQLLLTASQESRPALFDHAVAAMAVNGALMAASGADSNHVRIALLAGLLHDLGEMYLAPTFGEASAERDMDFVSYQKLVAHPHVGFLIIRQLCDYPSAVALAVGQHHEHMDGSGYPRAIRGSELSTHGRCLMVTEAVLNAMRDPYASLLNASVALRAVPGEFDPAWVGEVVRAANAAASGRAPAAVMEPEDIHARLQALTRMLGSAETAAAALREQAKLPVMQDAAQLAAYLLSRVRVGWIESGLWTTDGAAALNAAEVEVVEDEVYHRLRGVQRATRMRAGENLPPDAAEALELFCDGLEM